MKIKIKESQIIVCSICNCRLAKNGNMTYYVIKSQVNNFSASFGFEDMIDTSTRAHTSCTKPASPYLNIETEDLQADLDRLQTRLDQGKVKDLDTVMIRIKEMITELTNRGIN